MTALGSIPHPLQVRCHIKRKFTPEEDARLTQIVAHCGESNWRGIAAQLGGRNFRQCRERWKNYLAPNLSKDAWTKSEDELLVAKYGELGSRWSAIAKFFPSRTDVNCKNRWVVLASRANTPKRVRGKRGKEQQEQSDGELWPWHGMELQQAYEDEDAFRSEFTFN
jgi:hypothetical protein